MNTRIVFLEQQLKALRSCVFDRIGVEGAAFVLCGESRGPNTTKLICHAVLPVAPDDYLRREQYGLTISSRALSRVAKLARHEGLSVLFAHSHPEGVAHFSVQDDGEEEKLLPFIKERIPGRHHGTVVLTRGSIVGRIYCPDRHDVDLVISVGQRLQCFPRANNAPIAETFDRQVRAFGPDVQRLLGFIRVGVVGLGGTGSAVAEQLARLGVRHLSFFDGDRLDLSNVNRVYGSNAHQAGTPKVSIARENIERMGLGAEVREIDCHITEERAAKHLRDCDVVFGCTDRQLPRAILTQLSLKYSLPVIDMGVLIDSQDGQLRGVHGRVTTLYGGEACLFCRGRISPETIRIEALPLGDRARQAAEGYAPELETPAPAVIAFTSAVASLAVAELIHRLTGFRGALHSSECLVSFDENSIRTNRVEPRITCICADEANWGRGDEEPYLDMMWPTHTK